MSFFDKFWVTIFFWRNLHKSLYVVKPILGLGDGLLVFPYLSTIFWYQTLEGISVILTIKLYFGC